MNAKPTYIVGMGCDHAGYAYKESLIKELNHAGYIIKDFGTHSSDSVDYPDFVHPLAKSVVKGECNKGILICGSGNGVAITANKYPDIRAALCWTEEIASLARRHNDANVLCIPARFISFAEAKQIMNTFLSTPFEGGRHQNRVNKIKISG